MGILQKANDNYINYKELNMYQKLNGEFYFYNYIIEQTQSCKEICQTQLFRV